MGKSVVARAKPSQPGEGVLASAGTMMRCSTYVGWRVGVPGLKVGSACGKFSHGIRLATRSTRSCHKPFQESMCVTWSPTLSPCCWWVRWVLARIPQTIQVCWWCRGFPDCHSRRIDDSFYHGRNVFGEVHYLPADLLNTLCFSSVTKFLSFALVV